MKQSHEHGGQRSSGEEQLERRDGLVQELGVGGGIRTHDNLIHSPFRENERGFPKSSRGAETPVGIGFPRSSLLLG